MAGGLIYFLALLSICQFFIICFLIYERNHSQPVTIQEHKLERRLPTTGSTVPSRLATNTTISSSSSSSLSSCHQEIEGVAVTVFMGSPKWFQNRYSIMINQVLSSLGPTWKVQIFYRVYGTQMGIAATTYAGIQHKIKRGQVILTPIPMEFKGIKKKDFMIQPWFWKNMLHDRVLLFGGSTVLCANSPYEINDFLEYDLLGGPWGLLQGMGGDGALSIRNRTLMITALESEILESPLSIPMDKPDTGIVSSTIVVIRKATSEYAKKREEMAFIDALRKLEKKQSLTSVRIARREDTHRFVSSEGWWKGSSLGAVGTMAGLNHTARQLFLDYCPELKMLFPVLHYPDCFGAEPNPLLCIQAICEYGGIRCAEEIIKQKKQQTEKQSTNNRVQKGIIIHKEWFNVRRNITLKLSIQEMLSS